MTSAERDSVQRRADLQRTAIETKYAEPLASAVERVRIAHGALEAAEALPDRSQVEQEALDRRAEALRTLGTRSQVLGNLQAELAAAARTYEAALLQIGQAQARMGDLESEISTLGQRTVLTPTDVTEDMLQIARDETVQLESVLEEFSPVLEAATRTARINIGLHLPTLFRSRSRIEAMNDLAICGERRQHLRSYIALSIEGIEQFQTNTGAVANTLSSITLRRAEAELQAYRTLVCTSREQVAAAMTNARDSRFIRARMELESVSGQLARYNRLADEADGRRRALPAAVEIAATALAAAQVELNTAETSLREGAIAFSVASGPVRATRAEALRATQSNLQEATLAHEAAVEARSRELAAVLTTLGPVTAPAFLAQRQLHVAEEEVESKRTALGNELAADYMRRYVRISSRSPGSWNYLPRVCPEVMNSGPLIVESVDLSLLLRGRLIPDEVVGSALAYTRNLRRVGPTVENRYRETVRGLPPQRNWRADDYHAACATLKTRSDIRGDDMRALEAFGGYSANANDWRLVPREVWLARPETLHRSGAEWIYRQEANALIFSVEIRRIEEAALRPDTPSSVAIATATPGSTVVLTALDRRRLIQLQEGLKERGFMSGVADGAFGARTREAVRAWQRSRGETPSDTLSQGQLRELNILQ